MTKLQKENKELRVVFFGTPDFAIPCLDLLISKYNVVGCVTQPDKPQGRGQASSMTPIKKFALNRGITVLEPISVKTNTTPGASFINDLKALQPDIAVVVSYGKIIPGKILTIPEFGFINVHFSLLPKYRGASPIQTAILQGENKTGITIMLMDEGMDTGDILTQEELEILPTDNTLTLHKKLEILGAELLGSTLASYIRGAIVPRAQDNDQATYTKIIEKKDGEINWNRPADEIDRQVRAFTPWPGTYTFCREKRIKVLLCHLSDEGKRIIVDEVQPEGKKSMPYSEFIKGYHDCPLPPLQ